MNKYFVVLFFILSFMNVNAQEIKNNETGSWFTTINNFKITEKINVASVIQWRLVNFASYTRIFLTEPSINYKFNDKITAGLGYNYSDYHLVGIRPPSVDCENRFTQHITLFSSFGIIKMNQRFMFEERFLVKNNGDDFYANRFRYRINLDFKIVKFNNEKQLLGKVSEEVRIRFTEGISDPNFDQNNFVAAVGYPLLDNSKIYMGYGRNYYNGGASGYWGDHILNLAFSYDLDFTKKIE
jgi:hypothetical protein